MPSPNPKANIGERALRSHYLLQAVTSALQVLASGGDTAKALSESFDAAARALGAEKALLLRVKQADPLELLSLRSLGLEPAEVEACLLARSLDGVSPSQIRRAIQSGEPQLVENSQFESRSASETGSLAGRPYSVLCAPVSDPWTRVPLAVLYFQTSAGRDAYAAEDVPFVRGYATSLGHAFGLQMSGERRYLELEQDWKRLRRGLDAPELIGESEEVSRLRAELHETYLPGTAARPPRPILIAGDTGTGKDLVARYLHYYSPARSAFPFVEHNCAGLSGELAQSVLFGHVRGAFTSAIGSAPGLFRAADKGTLFLDEIGELPARGQELLLKVLDHWLVQPLGDAKSYRVDVQLVCATNRDLAEDARAGRFRNDLYQRLKALTLRLSPLSSRPGDIRPLLSHFLAAAERSLQKRTRGLAPEALNALLAYRWPGNVRELSGCCAALVSHARAGAEIDLELLRRSCPEVASDDDRRGRVFAEAATFGSFHEERRRFERQFLLDRLELHRWNVPEAARSLGVSAATLYRYLQRHGLRAREG